MYTWIKLDSSADFQKLETFVLPEYDPHTVATRLAEGLSNAIRAVLIESNYVDKDYRSTYYNFYAKKGRRYCAECVRLHFFDEAITFDPRGFKLGCEDNRLNDHYFGYMVLRPTGIATIGRSVMSPNVRNGARGSIITSDHKVHLLGYKLLVQGFPSMDQHIDISVCAHAACWSILRHYSERYSTYQEHLTHDVTLMAQRHNPGGLVPSKGLEVSHAERIFQEAGTFPVIVTRSKNDDVSFYRQLHTYVDSGFPLFAAMHARHHAMAVIGYERRASTYNATGLRYAWDELTSLIVIDDNHLPYCPIPIEVGPHRPYCSKDIDAFIVALPEKVYYPADAVDRLAAAAFTLDGLELPPKEQTIIRYFITTASAYRHFMRESASEFDPRLLEAVMVLPFAQFLWIVEYATEAQWDACQITARIVLGATASLREPTPFWLFHDRRSVVIFDRQTVGVDLNGAQVMGLSGMGNTALTRMDQNLCPIQAR